MTDTNRKTANNTNAMKHNPAHAAMKNASPKILLPILVSVFALCAVPFLTGASTADASAEPTLSPLDDLSRETGRDADATEVRTKQADAYRAQGEYDLCYRIYRGCVESGRIDGRAFYKVLRGDAKDLAAAHPEKRMTVLVEDGKKKPEEWQVARMRPEDKALIWKKKGVTPKKDWLTEKERTALVEAGTAKGLEFLDGKPSLTLEKCRRTLACYDLLRDHVQNLLDGTEERLVREAPGDEALESLRRDLLALKKEIRVARTRFVSYTLVSPFLAETVRLRRIAKDSFLQMLFNHRANAGKRLDAISMLALACHNEILMSCTEDVRIQFCDVVSGLKRISRPAEWEHFKTVTTMLDSYDPSKKRGADAWWE